VDFNPLVFEIFSISSFDPKLELLSMNVSSNHLDSLDDGSVMWLKDTATLTGLSGNPWKCDCTALSEAWRELRHKLTLNCVSPEDRRRRTWDLIEDLCPHLICFVEISSIGTLNISSDAILIVTTDTYSALQTLKIVVIFVCVVCFLVIPRAYYMQQKKKLRRRSEVPQNNEVFVSLTEEGSTVRVSTKLSSSSTHSTGHV